MPSAVVVAVDGLGSKHLGPYGNTWVETPAFNRLATEALLIDGLYVPSPDRIATYQSWWQVEGQHLIQQLGGQGIHTQLLTDEASLWDQSLVAPFAQQDTIETPEGVHLANEWQETHTAHFFAQAIQAIESLEDGTLLWLHFRGFHSPWDAPYAYREQFVDEEDPDATGSAQVPSLTLDHNYDPDTLHEIQCAHAGQVVLLDECLAVMHSVLARAAARQDTLLMVSSTGGFPLGEHLQVGYQQSGSLYHESLSVPALIRYPDGHLSMQRRQTLGEMQDLAECLRDWLVHHQIKPNWPEREFSISRHGNSWLLRTSVWHVLLNQLSESVEQDMQAAELYLQPDDQNEVNDVSDRCEAVVVAGRDFVRAWIDASAGSLPPLPAVLLEPMA